MTNLVDLNMVGVLERLCHLTVDSCNCGVKSPDHKRHGYDCHWRGHKEALELIDVLSINLMVCKNELKKLSVVAK